MISPKFDLIASYIWQVYEVVRPLVNLLHTDRDGMQNYEALRGLTNLAGFSEKLRYVWIPFPK